MFRALWTTRPGAAGRDALAAAFGTLEREVMEVVWSGGPSAVRDVQVRLPRAVAYTTVMTTLDRLYKKGFVTRERAGRAFVYQASASREQLEAAVAAGLLSGLMSNGSGAALPLLSNLVEAVGSGAGADDLLDALERLVRQKRRRLRGAEQE